MKSDLPPAGRYEWSTHIKKKEKKNIAIYLTSYYRRRIKWAVSIAASHCERNIARLESPQAPEFLTACQELINPTLRPILDPGRIFILDSCNGVHETTETASQGVAFFWDFLYGKEPW